MSWDHSTVGWLGALGALAAGVPAHIVIATEYLSVEDAQKALFPQADRFTEVVLALSPAQRDRVASLAGPQPRTGACGRSARCMDRSCSGLCLSMR